MILYYLQYNVGNICPSHFLDKFHSYFRYLLKS
jgi:hypothetical protein